MAFCVRSERNMDYIKTNKNSIGPGHYFKSTYKNYIKKKIHPPFEISARKGICYKIKDTPGPGSYDLIDNKSYNNKDSTYISTNNLNKEKEKNISTIHNNNYSSIILSSCIDNYSSKNLDISKYNRHKKSNSMYQKSEDTVNYIGIINNYSIDKIGLLSKDVQFNDNIHLSNNTNSNNKTNEIIEYDYGLYIKNPTKSKSKLLNIPLKIETGSLQRIISIPSKDMNGYSVGENKSLNLLIDKTNSNEYIGPGRYDIKLTRKPKGILEWSKCLNMKEIKNRTDNKKKKETLDELKKRGDEIKKIKLNGHKNSKLIKTHVMGGNQQKGLNDLNTKLFANNINKKTNIFNYYIDSRNNFDKEKIEIPGPGYYTSNLFKEKKENKKNKLHIFGGFGSSSNRFLTKNKSMQDIGPSTYFIEKNKFEKGKTNIFSRLKKQRLIDETSKLNKTRNNLKKIANFPGPGTYYISHSFINKSFNSNEIMDHNNERFKSKIDDTPGPGTYNFVNNDIKYLKKIKKLGKIINKSNREEEKRKMQRKKKINKGKKEDAPGVGTYNINEVNSIDYKIKMKYNQKLSYHSPFLMSSGRFDFQDKKMDLPMYDVKYIKDNLKYMAFSKAERFNNINKNNSAYLIGPGSYNLNKDEQWMKKTFNKLFSS